jgi:hypothetical protein
MVCPTGPRRFGRRPLNRPSAVLVLALLPAFLNAAVWPDRFGAFTEAPSKPLELASQSVWNEYGLQETERAEYASGKERFTAAAFRFRDPTGALAAFQWQSPAGATPSAIGKYAVETPTTVLVAYHNYLFRFDGRKPQVAEMGPMLGTLPRLDQSPLPALPGYLPAENLVPCSTRYVIGPASLEAFEPRIQPSLAAFHIGTEAQLAKYKTQGGELALAIFSFPTPDLARERLVEISKLPGAMVKRSGPLVAVILAPSDKDAAERVLARVNYQATISWSERVPTRRDNIGELILGIFWLAGVLILFCLVAGLSYGGLRLIRRRYFKRWAFDETLITLHLGDY